MAPSSRIAEYTQTDIDRFQKDTYRTCDFDLNDGILDDNLPTYDFDLGETRGPPRQPPTKNAGMIEALPLSCLTNFRYANRRSADLVDSCPQYGAIAKYARNALRGILHIGMGSYVACDLFYEQLCTPSCQGCGDFGTFFYLSTGNRVCRRCFMTGVAWLPLRPQQAMDKYGISRKIVKMLPQLTFLPGKYSHNEQLKAPRCPLVDPIDAHAAGVRHHKSIQAMNEYIELKLLKRYETYEEKVHERMINGLDPSRLKEPEGWDSDDLDLDLRADPLRFVATSHVPWLDTSRQKVDWGRYCRGCRDKIVWLRANRKFTAGSFRAHVEKHGEVINGRHQSNDPLKKTDSRLGTSWAIIDDDDHDDDPWDN